jgi:hypothetical protein
VLDSPDCLMRSQNGYFRWPGCGGGAMVTVVDAAG